MSGLMARVAIFDKWLASDASKEYREAQIKYNKWAIPKIDPLPSDWVVESGSDDPEHQQFGYFAYQHLREWKTINIANEFKKWLPYGGYPEHQCIAVVVGGDDDNEEEFLFSVFELGWEEALKLAQAKLRELMG